MRHCRRSLQAWLWGSPRAFGGTAQQQAAQDGLAHEASACRSRLLGSRAMLCYWRALRSRLRLAP